MNKSSFEVFKMMLILYVIDIILSNVIRRFWQQYKEDIIEKGPIDQINIQHHQLNQKNSSSQLQTLIIVDMILIMVPVELEDEFAQRKMPSKFKDILNTIN